MLTTPPLSLYVHLPWCVRKCPYCDFNSHEARGALPFAAYVDALLADLDHDLPLVWGRTVQTVFFGGGTPSLFPPEAIDAFLQGASARLRFAPGLRDHPGNQSRHRRARPLRALPRRRREPPQLRHPELRRRLPAAPGPHPRQRARPTPRCKLAQDAGFDNFNLDLMYALPQQTLAMAERDIERAIALQPTHISHYQLTLEPNTVFAARPPAGIPDDDASWDMQEHCQALLADAGYAQYEVSAYARPGRQCAHNLNYWRFGDYLGIGAGAHGKLTLGSEQAILRRWKVKHPAAYLASAGTPGRDRRRRAHRRRRGARSTTCSMRCGWSTASRWPIRSPHRPAARGDRRRTATRPARDGWLDVDGERVVPTELGRRFTNDVIALFLPDAS